MKALATVIILFIISMTLLLSSYAQSPQATLPAQTSQTQCLDFDQDKICEYVVLANGTMVANPSVRNATVTNSIAESQIAALPATDECSDYDKDGLCGKGALIEGLTCVDANHDFRCDWYKPIVKIDNRTECYKKGVREWIAGTANQSGYDRCGPDYFKAIMDSCIKWNDKISCDRWYPALTPVVQNTTAQNTTATYCDDYNGDGLCDVTYLANGEVIIEQAPAPMAQLAVPQKQPVRETNSNDDDNDDDNDGDNNRNDDDNLPPCSPSTIYRSCADTDYDDPREEETSNCGGEPCTPTEKEDSWTDEEEEEEESNDESSGDEEEGESDD